MRLLVFRVVLLLLAAGLALPAAAASAASPDLDAVLATESRSISPAGVSRQTRFEERFIRRAGHLWTEPVRRSNAVAAEADSTDGHAHFDFETAARHLSHDAQGQVQLAYVDPARSLTVQVPSSEYAATGFNGSWAAAAALIEPAQVAGMQPSQRLSTVAGARWYEQRQGSQRSLRVLWSQRLQVALKLEMASDDGALYRATSVKLLPATPAARLPWLGLERLPQKAYDDFMD